jgi:hypothetical protein
MRALKKLSDQRRRVFAACLTLAVSACAGAGVAVAAHGGGFNHGLTSNLAAMPGPTVIPNAYAVGSSAVPLTARQVAKTYRVFARSETVVARQATAASFSAAEAFGPFALSRGLDPGATRVLEINSHGQTLYAAPAAGAICVGSSDSVISGCSPYPLVAPNEIVGSSALCSPSGDLEFAALLPGDPTNVVGHFSDGSAQDEHSVNGAVSIYAKPGGAVPMSITWTNGTQSLKADTGVPPGTDPSSCGRVAPNNG